MESWGVENPEHLATWARATVQRFEALGERLQAGQLSQVEGLGLQHQLTLVPQPEATLCVGFRRGLSADQMRDSMKKILATWIS